MYETIGEYIVRYTYESDGGTNAGSIKNAKIKEIYDPFENKMNEIIKEFNDFKYKNYFRK